LVEVFGAIVRIHRDDEGTSIGAGKGSSAGLCDLAVSVAFGWSDLLTGDGISVAGWLLVRRMLESGAGGDEGSWMRLRCRRARR
jgi:hypothetical protein